MPEDVSAAYDFGEDAFAPPDAVRLSQEAETGARQFLNSLAKLDSNAAWVAAFEWCIGRTMRRTPGGAIVDEGPGIDLGIVALSQRPTINNPASQLPDSPGSHASERAPWNCKRPPPFPELRST